MAVDTATGPDVHSSPDAKKAPDHADPEVVRIVLAGLDNNADQFAREAAHEELSNKERKGPLWKHAAKNIWHTLTHEYQVVKKTQAKREEIYANENLRHHHGKSDERWREATVRRYADDFGEALINEEAGETFHKFGSPEAAHDPEVQRMREDILDIVRQIAQGAVLDKDSLEQMQKRMIEEWREAGISQQYIGEGRLLAHNLAEMGEQVKAALDARAGLGSVDRDADLEEILGKAEIVVGEAKVGSNVEIDATLSERLAEKMRGKRWLSESRFAKVASWLNNEVVVAGILSATLYGSQRALAFVPGLGAAVFAGMREARAIRDERALQDRRRDADAEQDPANKRQRELNETLFESRSAKDLIAEIGAFYDAKGLNITDRASLEQAIRMQAELDALLDARSRFNERTINYADVSSDEMEDRKFDLALAKAKLETDLEKLMADPAERSRLGLGPDESYKSLIGQEIHIADGLIMGEMLQSDKLFNKIKRKRVLTRVIITGLTAIAGGELLRQGVHLASDVVGNLMHTWQMRAERVTAYAQNFRKVSAEGDIEAPESIGSPEAPDAIGEPTAPATVGAPVAPETIGEPTAPDVIGSEGPTAPESVGGFSAPDTIGSPVAPETIGEIKNSFNLSPESKMKLPEGFTAETIGNRTTVTGPNGVNFSIELNKDGSLTPQSLEAMRTHGMGVVEEKVVIQGEPKTTEVKMSQTEFAQAHLEEMTKIDRTEWMVNGKPESDLNEFGLSNHVQEDGNILVSVRSMTREGSFNGNSSVDWKEAAEQGHMKIFLSASRGSQSYAFELTVNPDGTALIDKNGPMGALFNEDGKFIGGYEHAAVVGGQNPDGSTRIAVLATEVGSRSATITDTVMTPTYKNGFSYTITMPQEGVVPNSFSVTGDSITGEPGVRVVDPSLRAEFEEGVPTPEDFGIFATPLYARQKVGAAARRAPVPPTAPPPPTSPPPPPGPGPGRSTTPPPGPKSAPKPGPPPPKAGTPPPPGAGPNPGPNVPPQSGPNQAPNAPPNSNAQPGPGPQNTTPPPNADNSKGGNGPNKKTPPNNGPKKPKTGSANSTHPGGNSRPNPGGPNRQGSPNFTSQERQFLKALVDGETRVIPSGFDIDIGTSAYVSKLVVALFFEFGGKVIRRPGDNDIKYRTRLAEGVRREAQSLLDKIDSVSPGLKPIMMDACKRLADIRVPYI